MLDKSYKLLKDAFNKQNVCGDCNKKSWKKTALNYSLLAVIFLLLVPIVFADIHIKMDFTPLAIFPIGIAGGIFFIWIFKRRLLPVIQNSLKVEWIYTDIKVAGLNPFPLIIILLLFASMIPPLLYSAGLPVPGITDMLPKIKSLAENFNIPLLPSLMDFAKNTLSKIYLFNDNDIFMFATWIVWWPLFLIAIIIFRRIWCGGFCPFGLVTDIGNWIGKKFRLNNPSKAISVTKWVFVGFVTFATIGYLHDALNITNSVIISVEFLLFFFTFAFVIGLVLPRRSFCRLFCFLGTLPHLFGRLAFLGLKTDRDKCVKCEGKWCIAGENAQPQEKYNKMMPEKMTGLLNVSGCPMYINVPMLGHDESNRHCILCGNCIKLCPYDAIHYQYMTPGYELIKGIDLNFQEIFFMFGILGILAMFVAFEGGLLSQFANTFGMIQHWMITGSFAVLAVLALVPVFALVCYVSSKITGANYAETMKTAGYMYLPFVFMAFLRDVLITYAINGSFLKLIIPQIAKELLDIGLVLIGVLWSLYMSYKMMPLITQKKKFAGALPHMLFIIAISVFWFWQIYFIYHGFVISFLIALMSMIGIILVWLFI